MRLAGMVLGLGLGGFVDGSLHQIMHRHHGLRMTASIARDVVMTAPPQRPSHRAVSRRE